MYIQKAPQLETWAKFSQVENQASSNGVAIDFNNYRKFYAAITAPNCIEVDSFKIVTEYKKNCGFERDSSY